MNKFLSDDNYIKIRAIILRKAQENKQIIHGSQSFNRQSPVPLRKETFDYDILTKKPKKSAKNVSESLKRVLGKEVKIIKGKHKGTYRVIVNGKVIADYTQLKTKPKTTKSWGNEFRDIKSIKRNAQRLVKKVPFRREKDLDTLERIRKIEELETRFSL